MTRGRNARSSDAVADLLKNHHNQPLNVPSAGAPIVSAVGAPIPPLIGVTIGMPPRPHVQPVAPTVKIETNHAWQQRQEAMENTIM